MLLTQKEYRSVEPSQLAGEVNGLVMLASYRNLRSKKNPTKLSTKSFSAIVNIEEKLYATLPQNRHRF